MSEEHDADESLESGGNTTPINRRRFVKSLGIAGGAAALPIFTAQQTAAEDTNFEIDKVTGSKKKKLIATARSHSKFKRLQKYMRKKTNRINGNREVEVYETTDDGGEPYQVVGFTTKSGSSSEKQSNARSSIGITIMSGDVRNVGASRTVFDAEGLPKRVVEYSVTEKGIHENSTGISYNTDSVTGHVNVEFNPGSGSTDQISALYSKCAICKDVANFACSVGCSVGGIVACGFLSIAAPICATIYAAICGLISVYGCGRQAKFLCRRNGSC